MQKYLLEQGNPMLKPYFAVQTGHHNAGKIPAALLQKHRADNGFHNQRIPAKYGCTEIVLASVIKHILVKKPLTEQVFEEADCMRLQRILRKNGLPEIKGMMEKAAEAFVQEYYGDGGLPSL